MRQLQQHIVVILVIVDLEVVVATGATNIKFVGRIPTDVTHYIMKCYYHEENGGYISH